MARWPGSSLFLTILLAKGLMTLHAVEVTDCQNCGPETTKAATLVPDPENMIRSRCSYPCHCPDLPVTCPEGVTIAVDGCGCCAICTRQEGQICDMVEVCDSSLECVYSTPLSTTGICKVRQGRGCEIADALYEDGESFKLDCRTQCMCQNGTYGCVSLCPHENVRPSAKCRNPQLVRIRDACCRDWLCESTLWEHRPPPCSRYSTPWTSCSRSCGVGLSYRITNDNAECVIRNETRICMVRPCDGDHGQPQVRSVRRRHVCRATVKSATPIHLPDVVSNCTSVRQYQPKFCSQCAGRRCCQPQLSTTVRMDFRCLLGRSEEVHVTKDVMWIVKCRCSDDVTC